MLGCAADFRKITNLDPVILAHLQFCVVHVPDMCAFKNELEVTLSVPL